MILMFWRRLGNSQSMPHSISGFIKPLSFIKLTFNALKTKFNSRNKISRNVFSPNKMHLMWRIDSEIQLRELEFEAHTFFVVTVSDFELELRDTRNFIILLNYIKEWRLTYGKWASLENSSPRMAFEGTRLGNIKLMTRKHPNKCCTRNF